MPTVGSDYALLRRNYRIVGAGSEIFDGRRAIDVSLTNDYSGKRTMLLRIDAATKIVLDRREFAANGSLVSEVRFESIRYVASCRAAISRFRRGTRWRALRPSENLSPRPIAR